MNPSDFWCRAFLAAMTGNYSHSEWDERSASADVCEKAADAALAVAQRRGMVTGEREAPAPAAEPRDDGKPARVEAGQRWSMDFRDIGGAIEEYAIEAIGDELARLSGPRGVRYVTMREMLTSPRFAYIGPAAAPGPKLERPDPLPVEFTAERYGALWTLRAPELGALGIQVLSGRETYPMGSGVVRIKWDASTTPPSPVEVTVERAPKLERVEFRAAPDELEPGWWRVCVDDVGAFVMLPGDERVQRTDGNAIRIKWSYESPSRPIEVWIERGG